MAVHDVDLMLFENASEIDGQTRMKSGPSRQGEHGNLKSFDLSRPGARLIQAADDTLHSRAERTNDLDDKPLGAARRQAQHELHHAQLRHAHGLAKVMPAFPLTPFESPFSCA